MKKLLIISLVFFCFFSNAQSFNDTIIKNRPFAIHYVQQGETLYGLSRKYNAELNQIVVHNPIVIKGVNIGMKLLIPLQKLRNSDNIKKIKKSSDNIQKKNNEDNKTLVNFFDSINENILNVALLLPFYLELNQLAEDNFKKDKIFIYPKSETAINYYSGLLIALDTLKNIGHEIHLSVYDISNDSIFNELLNSAELDDKSLIIGPLLANQFNQLTSKYGFDNKKRLISPLSYKNVIKNYNNTYQFVPFPKIQMDTIVNYVKKIKIKNIVVVGQESEKNQLNNLKKSLFKKGILNFKTYVVEKNKFPEKDSLKSFLDSLENLIIVPSNNRSFVSRVIPILSSMEDTVFKVFGLESWNKFSSLDVTEINLLNLHLPSVFFQEDSYLFNDFVFKYYSKFKNYPTKYSYAAYKQFLFLISKKFNELYKFKKYKNNKGYINVKFPIFYFEDYEKKLIGL